MRAVSTNRLASKRAALERGRIAEEAAVQHLLASGFEVLWRNLRFGRDELDVVVRKGSILIVVEVRHRGDGAYTGGFESVDYSKRQKLIRATRALLRGPAKQLVGLDRCRIDVIDVTLGESGSTIRHAEAAVTAG